MEEQVLAGKAIVVTGAGRGLGRAYACDAARRGASVVVNDVDADAAADTVAKIETAGGRAVRSTESVAEEHAANGIIEAALAAFGRLDGLVNNAGAYYHTPAWEDSLEQIQPVVSVNLIGTMLCGIAAMRAMRRAGAGGSIVNITSGTHLGSPLIAAYVATKGGIVALTKSWALDLKDSGIRVNAISPVAQTTMMGRAPGGPRDFPSPDAVAPLCSWLLSDRAQHVSGQVVRLTGAELRVLKIAEHVDPPVRHEEWTFEALESVLGKPAWASWVPELRPWR
jgi:NAD(P)-dependent dehydrogenase (short-subunit alcohol dehydrogenase family)